MLSYLLLVVSLYAILVTAGLIAVQLGTRFGNRVSTFLLATIAAAVCAIFWESFFAVGSIVKIGPYSPVVQSYGYTTLTQPIGLFCIRSGLTAVLALPVALLTLSVSRSQKCRSTTR